MASLRASNPLSCRSLSRSNLLCSRWESTILNKKAIKIDAHNAEYWFTLGKINSKLNLIDEAALAYKKATELDPLDQEFWNTYKNFLNSYK